MKLYPGRDDNKEGDRISHDPFGHYQKKLSLISQSAADTTAKARPIDLRLSARPHSHSHYTSLTHFGKQYCSIRKTESLDGLIFRFISLHGCTHAASRPGARSMRSDISAATMICWWQPPRWAAVCSHPLIPLGRPHTSMHTFTVTMCRQTAPAGRTCR